MTGLMLGDVFRDNRDNGDETGWDGTGGAKTFLQSARSMDSTLMIGLVLGEVFPDHRDYNGDGTG